MTFATPSSTSPAPSTRPGTAIRTARKVNGAHRLAGDERIEERDVGHRARHRADGIEAAPGRDEDARVRVAFRRVR